MYLITYQFNKHTILTVSVSEIFAGQTEIRFLDDDGTAHALATDRIIAITPRFTKKRTVSKPATPTPAPCGPLAPETQEMLGDYNPSDDVSSTCYDPTLEDFVSARPPSNSLSNPQ